MKKIYKEKMKKNVWKNLNAGNTYVQIPIGTLSNNNL